MSEPDTPVDSPPTSPDTDSAASPLGGPFGAPDAPPDPAARLAASRTVSTPAVPAGSTTSNMTASSTPLGSLNAARGSPSAARPMAGDIAARMAAFTMSRQGGPPTPGPNRGPPGGMQSPGPQVGGFPSNFRLPPGMNLPGGRPGPPQMTGSSPAVPGAAGRGPPSMAERRGLKLPGGLPGGGPAGPAAAGRAKKPGLTLSAMAGGAPGAAGGAPEPPKQQSQMEKYAEFVDTKAGALTFKGKAVVHGGGVEFSSGKSYSLSLDEVDQMDELGKGNYGTVYKVRHARPKFRMPGGGISKKHQDSEEDAGSLAAAGSGPVRATPTNVGMAAAHGPGGLTGKVMAMKEMRLELDDAKFASIIMELDILHRCISPHIVDFYGAFFQEGAVYICMEWMDGGSIDKIYGDGVPEGVLRKITHATVNGLKALKEEHNIIHRDVKPTNILANSRGQVKICDFGVSGNLVASIAKTNIGCQSYMAPERIRSGDGGGGGMGAVGTYSVQSDIWSLGLTIIECALGRYPYPPETYDNIFSQLSAIVDGQPPDLPADKFSEAARDFVAGCLNKIPNLRSTYPMLLQHAWLAPLEKPATITEEDEEAAEKAAEAGEPLPQVPAETLIAGEDAAAPLAEGASATALDGSPFIDREVGEWVIGALERRRTGKMAKSAKPALHAAPLDASAVAA